MREQTMSLADFDFWEAIFWFVLAAILLLAAARRPPGSRYAVVAGVTFILFGVSDLVEMRTSAWFEPWWLLVWKAACVLVLVGCYWKYRQLKNRS